MLAALVLLPAACGSTTHRAPGCPKCAATIAQTRADTFASVATRIYQQEVVGPANGAAVAQIAPLPGLVDGLAARNYAEASRALTDQPVRHAVRARVVRGGRVLVDVGLGFVIAGNPHPLSGPGGRRLGEIEVSIQDVIGYIRLIRRLTGTQVVVRGSLDHHLVSSLPPALAVRLPATGPVVVNRRPYTVSSFARPGFGGEQLTVWVLTPG